MLFFFAKLQDKIFAKLPANTNKTAISNRLIMSIFWQASDAASRAEAKEICKKIVAEWPEEKKTRLLSNEESKQAFFEDVLEKSKPDFLPENKYFFDLKKLENGVECFQNYRDYLNGFSEPFKTYLTVPEFISFLEDVDKERNLAALIDFVAKLSLPIKDYRFYWFVSALYVRFLTLFSEILNGENSASQIIYGVKQLLCAKYFADIFDDLKKKIYSLPEICNEPNQSIQEEKANEIALSKLGFVKDSQNFQKLLELPSDVFASSVEKHLESFSNKPGLLIKKAGAGSFASIDLLANMGFLKRILELFVNFDFTHRFIDDLELIFHKALLEQPDFFEQSDLDSYFESLKNTKTIVKSSKIDFYTEIDPVYSYLLFHCNRPFKLSWSIANIGSEDLKDLKFKKIVKGNLGTEETIVLGDLLAGKDIRRADKIEIPGDYLKTLEEPQSMTVELQILSGNEIIYAIEHEIDLFPWNQYFEEPIPEAIACFVTPNVDEIHEAIKVTKKILSENGFDTATEGYQRGIERVLQLIHAVYLTPSVMGISYSNPPSSIADRGQKVRLPHQVFKEEKGTCLDLSVLYAALLEEVGLHPVIVMVRGHAFPGCYLTDTFYHSCEKSLETVFNHLKSGNLLLFNSTSALKKAPFKDAIELADKYVYDSFEFMVDIVAAHKIKINPYPIGKNIENAPTGGIVGPTGTNKGVDEPVGPVVVIDKKLDAIEKFKVKLLNLSSSNPLLNHPFILGSQEHANKYSKSKTAIYLDCENFDAFESAFVQNEATLIDCYFQDAEQLNHYLMQPGQASGKTSNFLVALLPFIEFNKRCHEIKKKDNQEIAEKGTSSLVLGLGMVKYTDGQKQYFGPLVLYSVRLKKDEKRNKWALLLEPDSIRINETLLYKLKKINAELDFFKLFQRSEADRDEGKNWNWILTQLRERLRLWDGFDIIDKAVLDFFPFSRYLLVQELDEKPEQLINNNLMAKFLELDRTVKPTETINGSASSSTNEPEMPLKGINGDTELIKNEIYAKKNVEELTPENAIEFSSLKTNFKAFTDPYLFNPKFLLVERADSTQLKVIQASLDGESFILEGPPGTGKTTTITNIVALNLLKGKKILFVAEKTTAMDQLAKGLEKCGLSSAVLKFPASANGKWLVNELCRFADTELPEIRTGEVGAALMSWEEHRKELFGLTKALGQHTALEERAHTIFARAGEDAEAVIFNCPEILQKDLLWLSKAKNILHTYQARKKAFKLPESKLLQSINPENEFKETELKQLSEILNHCIKHIEGCADLITSSGLSEAVCLKHLKTAYQTFKTKESAVITPIQKKLLESLKTPELFTKIKECTNRTQLQNENRNFIYQTFRDVILTFSGFDALLKEFEEYHTSTSFWKIFKANPAKAKCKQFIKNQDMSDQKIYEGLLLVATFRADQKLLSKLKVECETLFKSVTGNSINWATIIKTIEEIEIQSIKPEDVIEEWCQRLKELDEILKIRFVDAIDKNLNLFLSTLGKLQKMLGLNLGSFFGVSEPLELRVNDLKMFCNDLQAVRQYSSKARLLNNDLKTITELGIDDFLKRFGPIEKMEEIGTVFEKSFYTMWKTAYSEQHAQISNFIREEQDLHCEEFAKFDEQLLKKAPQFIAAQILHKIHNDVRIFTDKKAFLNAEARRIRRFLSIRNLLLNLEARYVLALRPCFILNPMQVAEHLPLDYPAFDMVIFDEASQVEPACAISALRRAKQWLIVGDSKQMPPSKSRGVVSVDFADEESEDSPAAELESILDECTRCLSKIYWLSWHYRSKDERLISFSNDKFYAGNLVTFPGADDGGGNFGINYNKVIGYCGSRMFNPQLPEGTNRVEAEFIVNFVIEKLRDETMKKRSYGVIASNDNQAELITELFNQALTPIEKAIFLDDTGTGLKTSTAGSYEPLWIKPLEQVQGDERDVILLSTGFSAIKEGQRAPEPGGKPVSNFGKLAHAGAERRLNVALTRAREQLVVVTSMNSTDISDTGKNLGPKYLREFLSFLEMENQKSNAARNQQVKSNTEQLKRLSPMVRDISERLQQKGYIVENNLGYSSYKIEIAVKDSENPGRYLLAIETDGEVYQKAATSRDRDILRPAILKVFGWGDLYRVWLLEYMKSPEEEIEKIVAAIEKAKGRPIRSPMFSNKNLPETPEEIQTETGVDVICDGPTTTGQAPNQLEPFKPYSKFTVDLPFEKDIFDNEANTRELCEIIYKIVQHESPISVDLLKTRIKEVFGYGRFGAKMENRLNKLLSSQQFAEHMCYAEEQETIWDSRNIDQRNKMEPRLADNNVRPFDFTPFDEIYAGTHKVLKHLISAEADTLAKETCSAFGLSKVSEKAGSLIKAAIEAMIKDGLCINDNGVIRLKELPE